MPESRIKPTDAPEGKEDPKQPKGRAAAGSASSGERSERKTQPRRRDALQGVEDKLNDLAATIALGQQGIGIAAGDQRMMMSGHLTAEMMPGVIHAWVELGRENANVKRALIRMSEGGAWGGVLFTTIGFAYSQAQVWEVVPAVLPNPWVGQAVPASDEVTEAAAANGETPWTPRTPEDANPGVDQTDNPVHVEAEKTRRAVEERRKREGA